MRNEENIGHTVWGKRAITSLSQMCEISMEEKKKQQQQQQKNHFLLSIDN